MRWPWLPGYRRQPPDPIQPGVMAPGLPVPRERTRWYQRQQAGFDWRFWGLVHDNDWLQYHPSDSRLRRFDRPRRNDR
jgi:hypothetical protein